MSMDFSEFLRRLGADPGNRDPEFLHARKSDPEFEQAAAAAEAFEARLERAADLRSSSMRMIMPTPITSPNAPPASSRFITSPIRDGTHRTSSG